MQTTIDIDAALLKEVEKRAKRQGLPLSEFIAQALRHTLRAEPLTQPVETYGEPLSDEDIEASARVTFHALDEEERRANSR